MDRRSAPRAKKAPPAAPAELLFLPPSFAHEAATVICSLPMRILLVEDDSLTLHAMSRLLRSCGYEVDAAATAAEAMTAAEGRAHALVLTDIGLPDGTGESLMRELRELTGTSASRSPATTIPHGGVARGKRDSLRTS